MVVLSEEEKKFVKEKLKPLLKKNSRADIIELCIHNNMQNIICWLLENNIDILSELNTIPRAMFKNCQLGKIHIPSSIYAIKDEAFKGSDLSMITFDEGIESIEASAFEGTNVSTIELPNSLRKIGTGCFKDCVHLTKVFIPDSVTLLPRDLFAGCQDSLKVYANSRKNLPPSKRLNCPQSEINWYKDHLYSNSEEV